MDTTTTTVATTAAETEPFFTTDMIIIMVVGILMIVLVLVYAFVKNKIQAGRREGKIKGSTKEYILMSLYRFYSRFFLTENSINNIRRMLAASCLYTPRESFQVAAKWETQYCITIIVIGCLAFALYDDFISIALVFVFAFYFASSLLNKKMDKNTELLLDAYRKSLAAVQEGYMKTGDVAESISTAEIEPILKPIFNEVYNILTGHNGDLRLREFIEKVPFRQLQIFAQICYDINNTGDEILPNGQSNFQVALESMTEDAISELERLHYQQDEFGNLEYLALIPLVGMKPLRFAMISQIPAVGVIYDSMLGYILRVLLLACSIIAYNYISSANSTKVIREDDRNYFFTRLVQKKGFWRSLATHIAPKNYYGYGMIQEVTSHGKKMKFGKKLIMKKAKLELRFRQALSKLSVQEFALQKVTFCFLATIATILVLYFSVQLGYQQMYTNTAQLSLVGGEYSVEVTQEDLLAMDMEYLALKEQGQEPRGEELNTFVKEHLGDITDMEINDEVTRITTKSNSLDSTYFHWWFILVAFGVGIVGYYVPDFLLFMRKRQVEAEAEADFLVQQTFMSIFMYTTGDTLDALKHMTELSQIHKMQLAYCYYSYTCDPDGELAWLQAQTPLSEYKRFIGKLRLTTQDLSLSEAYADLHLTRQYIQKERDRKLRKQIHAKSVKCSMASKVPMYTFLFAYMVVPIAYVAVSSFSSTYSQMGSL